MHSSLSTQDNKRDVDEAISKGIKTTVDIM